MRDQQRLRKDAGYLGTPEEVAVAGGGLGELLISVGLYVA